MSDTLPPLLLVGCGKMGGAMLAGWRERGLGETIVVDPFAPGPIPGATLTLDFPHRGERTLRLLDELDRIAISAGGRVNPYKDARMSPASFAASFPQWRDFDLDDVQPVI